MVEQLLFQSVADRDGMVASAMQHGGDDRWIAWPKSWRS
jgi:hypothetical protein